MRQGICTTKEKKGKIETAHGKHTVYFKANEKYVRR